MPALPHESCPRCGGRAAVAAVYDWTTRSRRSVGEITCDEARCIPLDVPLDTTGGADGRLHRAPAGDTLTLCGVASAAQRGEARRCSSCERIARERASRAS